MSAIRFGSVGEIDRVFNLCLLAQTGYWVLRSVIKLIIYTSSGSLIPTKLSFDFNILNWLIKALIESKCSTLKVLYLVRYLCFRFQPLDVYPSSSRRYILARSVIPLIVIATLGCIDPLIKILYVIQFILSLAKSSARSSILKGVREVSFR
jgi:hypothetical protein